MGMYHRNGFALSLLLVICFLSFFPTYLNAKSSFIYKDACWKGMKGCDQPKPGLHGFLALTGGITWADPGESQSFTDDSSLYQYQDDAGSETVGLWGITIGGEWSGYPDLSFQLGLSYYQSGSFNPKGTVTQGVDPASSETYPYQYNIIARQYLLQGSLSGSFIYDWVHPYMMLGLGAAFNSAYDYDAVPNTPFPFATFTPQYASQTTTSFSYIAGFGFDFEIMKYARIGLGYRYVDFGEVDLGTGQINNVTISHTLDESNLRAQEVVAQLTIVI